MKLTRNSLISILLLPSILTISSCSDVKNRSQKPTVKNQPTISLSIQKRSTTQDGQTSETINKNIEKTITKSLTQLLISGSQKENLFSNEALPIAQKTFQDNTDVDNNSADVSLNYLVDENQINSLIVAEVKQTTIRNNKKITMAGTISFDPKGTIIGFSYEPVAR